MQFLKKIKNRISQLSKTCQEYSQISNSAEIARRCFATNSFDGFLTVLGILVGGYVGKIREPRIIVITGLGAAIAMGVSGFWGAYETEKAERARSLHALERATLSSLQGTMISRAGNFTVILVSLIDGFSPSIAGLLVVSPFFLTNHLTISQMYFAGSAISFIGLALLGGYLGKLSKSNILVSSLKMVFAGIVCAGIGVLFIGLAT